MQDSISRSDGHVLSQDELQLPTAEALSMIEVSQVLLLEEGNHPPSSSPSRRYLPNLSAPMVKLHLRRMCRSVPIYDNGMCGGSNGSVGSSFCIPSSSSSLSSHLRVVWDDDDGDVDGDSGVGSDSAMYGKAAVPNLQNAHDESVTASSITKPSTDTNIKSPSLSPSAAPTNNKLLETNNTYPQFTESTDKRGTHRSTRRDGDTRLGWTVSCGSAYLFTSTHQNRQERDDDSDNDSSVSSIDSEDVFNQTNTTTSHNNTTIDLSSDAYDVLPQPIIVFPSSDPTDLIGTPCIVRVYSTPRSYRLSQNRGSIPKHQCSPVPKPTSLRSLSVAVTVVDGTAVRILPPVYATAIDMVQRACLARILPPVPSSPSSPLRRFLHRISLKDAVLGECEVPFLNTSSTNQKPKLHINKQDDYQDDYVLSSYEPDIVRALEIRMKALVHKPIFIGTTVDALSACDNQTTRTRRMRRDLTRFWNQRVRTNVVWNERAGNGNADGSTPSSSTAQMNRINPQQFEQNDKDPNNTSNTVTASALTVHDPHHSSGKTTLVTRIAQVLLRCHAIHTINGAALIAKYGASGADAALEVLLHKILLGCAVRHCAVGRRRREGYGRDDDNDGYDGGNADGAMCCIILDHLETFVPPVMSGRTGVNDPAVPTLNAMAAYLNKMVHSITTERRFPYPSTTKIPLYNLTTSRRSGGSSGYVFPVRLCLIGIVTCDDDIVIRGNDGGGSNGDSKTVLDVLGENRYRLPLPSPQGRYDAFRRAFIRFGNGLELSEGAQRVLPEIVGKYGRGACGRRFEDVARNLECLVRMREDDIDGVDDGKVDGNENDLVGRIATETEIIAAFRGTKPSVNAIRNDSSVTASSSSRHVISSKKDSSTGVDTFASTVGGNLDARRALVNALALDKRIHKTLARFNLSPPTGVLLYGPPGTGKTLMAKATAQALMAEENEHGQLNKAGRSKGGGGTFLSIRVSDIVRSGIGESERLVVSVFEEARANAPSVVFIDEFEALFSQRDGGGSARLASTLLQCMDDVTRWRDADLQVTSTTINADDAGDQSEGDSRVVVLGATNVPWMVDRAFLRAGRFDRVVYVGLPDERDRKAILKVHVGRMKLSRIMLVTDGVEGVVDGICRRIAKDTEGFSGADLAGLCRAAAVRCLHEIGGVVVSDEDDGQSFATYGVREEHFRQVLDNNEIMCSNSDEVLERLKRWRP